VSIESSSNSNKARMLDLNALRNAQIGGGAVSPEKKEISQDRSEQPSFEKLLNDIVNSQMEAEKEIEVAKMQERISPVNPELKPKIGYSDGFKHDGERTEWGIQN